MRLNDPHSNVLSLKKHRSFRPRRSQDDLKLESYGQVQLRIEPCQCGGIHLWYVTIVGFDQIDDRMPYLVIEEGRAEQIVATMHVELTKIERFFGISLEWKALRAIKRFKKNLLRQDRQRAEALILAEKMNGNQNVHP